MKENENISIYLARMQANFFKHHNYMYNDSSSNEKAIKADD